MIEVNKNEISKEKVEQWFAEWQEISPTIHAAHERRDKTAASAMEAGINLYENFIAKASNVEAFSVEQQYEVLPINAMERMAFIKHRPGQYACYRQLDELFTETKKRCARLRLKK